MGLPDTGHISLGIEWRFSGSHSIRGSTRKGLGAHFQITANTDCFRDKTEVQNFGFIAKKLT